MSPPKSNDGGGHQDGDGLAARWMARHWAAMVEAARRYAGGCPMTAEDIAQEALWAAFERRDRLVDPAGERAWLLAFVGNEGRAAATRVSDDDHSNSAPEIAWPLTSVAAAERRSVSPAETVAESGVTARATAT